ncbi:MAG: amino acid permease [Gemmatimonadaceae bacterium]
MRMTTPLSPPRALSRQIGLPSAVAIVIGTTIGSGIFRSPAGIAAKLPGPLPMLSAWVVGGMFALCGALSLAELAGAYPQTGGIYVYVREGWGRLAAFLFGWSELIIIRAAALGAIATTFAEYLMRVAGRDPGVAPNDNYVHYVAAVAIAINAILNAVGLRWGERIQMVTTIAKYGGLLVLVVGALVVGLPAGAAHFAPAVPPGSFNIAPFGLALVSVLWVFDGWADVSFLAGEVKDPQRVLPRAILGGTLAVLGIYLAANVAYLSVLTVDQVRASKLVAADVAAVLLGPPGVALVAVTVMISTFGTLNASILTSPRIFFAMAADGLLLRGVARVHPRYGTPYVAILLSGALGVGFVLLRTFEQLADTFVTAIVPFYALGVAAIFVLRRRPGYAPTFRAPGYPVVPALFVVATILLLGNAVADPTSRWPTLAVFGVILLGIPIYYGVEAQRRGGEG